MRARKSERVQRESQIAGLASKKGRDNSTVINKEEQFTGLQLQVLLLLFTMSSSSVVTEKSPFFRPNITRNGKRISPNRHNRVFGHRDSINNNNNSTTTDNDNNNNGLSEIKEHKSTIIGCSSNLINAIVGAGIVGIPYAIQESGFIPGIFLILFSGIVTEKSLRLLVETAKHSNVPSYETLMEACYGRYGFLFVSINMMIISYGAMLSYLMIIKDTFSTILGINETDILERRCILLIISIIPLLLSCQRDMADLAITSKMNVVLDFIMVLLVVYLAKLTPTKILNTLGLTDYNEYDDDKYVGEYAVEYYGNENSPTTTIMKSDYYNDINNNSSFIQSPGIIPIPSSSSSSYEYEYELSSESSLSFSNNNSIFQIQYKTIFIGLGVLSFAFVCQHSAFIIAGSLTKPTKDRWSKVTKLGVYSAVSLALLMGICGYLGFSTTSTNNEEDDGYQSHQRISGNILNSLPTDSTIANIARGLLGITMLFVYPMESFVARHSCVVLFFHGRQAHDGDDASVLNRRSRRITLTVVLYLLAVIPAALFNDLGNVLAITGSIGGSCLSYIGPGIVYIGIHGGRLLELNDAYFGNNTIINNSSKNCFVGVGVMIQSLFKTMLWYVIGMPIWIKFATIGKQYLTNHISDMALKSPHPIRIGNVRFVRAKVHGNQRYTRVVMLQKSQQNNNINVITNKNIEYRRSNSLSSSPSTNTTTNISTNGDDQHNRHRHQNNHHDVETKPLHADSLPKLSKDNDSYKVQTMKDGTIVALPASAFFTTTTTTTTQRGQQHQQQMLNNDNDDDTEKQSYQSVIETKNRQDKEEDEIVDDDDLALEDDPQRDPPSLVDFLIAISYVIFGVIALAAGLMSIFFG